MTTWILCRSRRSRLQSSQSVDETLDLVDAAGTDMRELTVKERVMANQIAKLNPPKGVVTIDTLTGERVSLESEAASWRLTMYDDRASAEAGTGHTESGGSGDDVDTPDVSKSTNQRAARAARASFRGSKGRGDSEHVTPRSSSAEAGESDTLDSVSKSTNQQAARPSRALARATQDTNSAPTMGDRAVRVATRAAEQPRQANAPVTRAGKQQPARCAIPTNARDGPQPNPLCGRPPRLSYQRRPV